MDEVSSHVCLVLPSTDGKAARKIVPPRLRIQYWKGLGADSEEKHEPVSDIDTVVVDSLKALDPKRPIREVGHRAMSGSCQYRKRPNPFDNVSKASSNNPFRLALVGLSSYTPGQGFAAHCWRPNWCRCDGIDTAKDGMLRGISNGRS